MHGVLALLWLAAMNAENVVVLPGIDPAEARARHPAVRGAPLRFAEARPVSIDPDTHGHWHSGDRGTRSWALTVKVPGATDLNLGFGRFRIGRNSGLRLEGRFQGEQFGKSYAAGDGSAGELWTAILPGDTLSLELEVPAGDPEPDLQLTQVAAGFRDAWERAGGPGLKAHGDCNNDVKCPEGQPWRRQIRSVALYSLNGTLACSGSLINDVPGGDKRFFLTASHCGVDQANAASVVTYWNYESPVCGDRSGGSLDQSVSGASLRASREDVDLLLLELAGDPVELFGAFLSGWDRSNVAPAGSVGIHHPRGHVKSISFNQDPLATIPSCIRFNATAPTHWKVDNWEDGTTEPGSSGSGLWDRDSHLLVGFLSGGAASCSFPEEFDCYGKFAVAWDGPDPQTRLKDWLDPDGDAPVILDGRDPARLFGDGFEGDLIFADGFEP